jgi:uncharacterized protein YacL
MKNENDNLIRSGSDPVKQIPDPSTQRIVLIGLNTVGVLLVLLAVILIIISTCFFAIYKNDYVFFQSFQNKITIAFVSLGTLSLITGLLGFYSIHMKNYLFMPILIIGILVLCLLLIGLGTWAFLIGDESGGSLLIDVEKVFNQTILNYEEGGQEESLDIKNIDFFQTEFKCCGWESYKDWKMSSSINSLKPILQYKFLISPNQIEINVPDTCCINFYASCGKDYTLNKTIFNQGCRYPLKKLLGHLRIFVFSVSLALGLSYLLSAIFFTLVITIFEGDYNLLSHILEHEKNEAKRSQSKRSERRKKKRVLHKSQDI